MLETILDILSLVFISIAFVYSVLNFLIVNPNFNKKYRKHCDIICIILSLLSVLYLILK